MLTLERCALLSQHRSENLELLPHLRDSFFRLRVTEAVRCVFRLVPARSDSEIETSVAQHIEHCGLLRQRCGGTKRFAQHQGSEPCPCCRSRDRGERYDRLERSELG